MRRIELDFLSRKPVVPWVSWLLLAVGLAAVTMVAWQYSAASEALKQEADRAEQLARAERSDRMRLPTRTARVDPGEIDQTLLGKPWGALFISMERSLPAKIGLLDLEADGLKSQLTLTAETQTPGQMLDYLNELRKQPGFSGVTLTSHLVDDENPQRPVQFVVRLNWGQP